MRELTQKKQWQNEVVARLRTEQIDARWVGEAILIMDEYGYGLSQFRKKVVPLLKSRIEKLLLEEGRQNEPATRLSQAIALRIEALKQMTRSTDKEDGDHG